MDEGNFETIESIEGVSVDNINPTTPDSLSGSHNDDNILLTWNYEQDIDFNYHQINDIYNETLYSTENEITFIVKQILDIKNNN